MNFLLPFLEVRVAIFENLLDGFTCILSKAEYGGQKIRLGETPSTGIQIQSLDHIREHRFLIIPVEYGKRPGKAYILRVFA